MQFENWTDGGVILNKAHLILILIINSTIICVIFDLITSTNWSKDYITFRRFAISVNFRYFFNYLMTLSIFDFQVCFVCSFTNVLSIFINHQVYNNKSTKRNKINFLSTMYSHNASTLLGAKRRSVYYPPTGTGRDTYIMIDNGGTNSKYTCLGVP